MKGMIEKLKALRAELDEIIAAAEVDESVERIETAQESVPEFDN